MGDLIAKSMKPCAAALKDAGLSKGEIDEVILVGGMTRMPKVMEEVSKFFGKEPHKGVNPDEVVAMGAAIQAGIKLGLVQVQVRSLRQREHVQAAVAMGRGSGAKVRVYIGGGVGLVIGMSLLNSVVGR